MNYSVKVTPITSKEGSNMKGFAMVVFGEIFKITNIAILENKGNKKLFISMPRYKSSEQDERGGIIYKDVCNPITTEFREKLYTDILEAYEKSILPEQEKTFGSEKRGEDSIVMPEFSVVVSPFEREGSNMKGLARIYFDNSFIVNNVSLLQGKETIFVSMPSYKTKQIDENGKAIYQDICYPVTKEFREQLYTEIIKEYEQALEKNRKKSGVKEDTDKQKANGEKKQEKERTPFR